MTSPEAISPTAHYTGYVWYRHGLSHPAFATREGRVMYYGLRPAMFALRSIGAPTLEGFLLARHRLIDHRLDQAIASGAVGQVVEVACGLSARGLRFTRRHENLVYIEADLPGMAARKRKVLERARGPETARSPRHRVVDLDALTDDGPQSLDALAGTLDPTRGLAIVTEGLLNYFHREHVLGMWRRFSRVLAQFPSSVYLSDLHVGAESSGKTERAFGLVLASFVRGRLHLHFRDAGEAKSALVATGFHAARLHRPIDFDALIGPVEPAGAGLVRIIEAHSTLT